MFTIRWPFTNMHELDLDWLIEQIKQQQTDLQNFVSLNTIKYAVPFQWDITSQYAQNTLVIDPQDGTAYLSIQPVPQGVQLENTDYWTPVFTLKNFIDPLKAAICRSIPQQEDGQGATQTIPANSLFFVGNTLCTNSAEIPNTSLVIIGSNCMQVSVEELLSKLSEQIAQETTAREQADTQLQQNIAAEQTAREQADNQLQQNITAEQTAREQADSQLQEAITAEQTAREQADTQLQQADTQLQQAIVTQKVNITDVKTAGAKGDGVTDDTAAIQAALDNGGCVYFPEGNYRVTSTLIPISNTKIYGCGTITLDNQTEASTMYVFSVSGNNSTQKNNITFDGITITANNPGAGYVRGGITIVQTEGLSTAVVDNIQLRNLTIEGFSGRGLNTFAGAAGGGFGHGYPRVYVSNVRIFNCGTTPFCNSGVIIYADTVFLNNPNCQNESLTIDNSCRDSLFSNFYIAHTGGGSGAVGIDEARNLHLVNFEVNNSTSLPAIAVNCNSGNVDSLHIANATLLGGNYGVKMGTSSHPAQVMLTNVRISGATNDFNVVGNGVLIAAGCWFPKTTSSVFSGFPGTCVQSGCLLET